MQFSAIFTLISALALTQAAAVGGGSSALSFVDTEGETLGLVTQAAECTPASYWCARGSGQPDQIWVCNAQGFWQVAALCGGYGCCNYLGGNVAYCLC